MNTKVSQKDFIYAVCLKSFRFKIKIRGVVEIPFKIPLSQIL